MDNLRLWGWNMEFLRDAVSPMGTQENQTCKREDKDSQNCTIGMETP